MFFNGGRDSFSWPFSMEQYKLRCIQLNHHVCILTELFRLHTLFFRQLLQFLSSLNAALGLPAQYV